MNSKNKPDLLISRHFLSSKHGIYGVDEIQRNFRIYEDPDLVIQEL
jgi:hypothetical protein